MPLTLGLQNGDELNFGVSDFWSYFSPFDEVSDWFDEVIDAWMAGGARIAVTGRRSRLLQTREDGSWETVYKANDCILRFRRTPTTYVINDPSWMTANNG